MDEIRGLCRSVIGNVEKVIIGQREAIELILAALLCEGHVLIEDVPGVGKTMLAAGRRRVAGRDLQAAAVHPRPAAERRDGRVGLSTSSARKFEFIPGPAFSNILLADEVNRATPRTQSALLECMGERQVTVDGVTRPLPRPVHRPGHTEPDRVRGHFPAARGAARPLPDQDAARLPRRRAEGQMLLNLQRQHPIAALEPVFDGARLPELSAAGLGQSTSTRRCATTSCGSFRQRGRQPDLLLGASPRGSLALYKTSQAWAALHGRDYVLPDDVKRWRRSHWPTGAWSTRRARCAAGRRRPSSTSCWPDARSTLETAPEMLYLVATPIGNLGDITLRALEDPEERRRDRVGGHAQDRHPAEALTASRSRRSTFQEHNEDRAGERIMALLAEGKSVAIVSEAGTPGISDPGYTIVQRAIAAGEAGQHGARRRRRWSWPSCCPACPSTASPIAASRRTRAAPGAASSRSTPPPRTPWSSTKARTGSKSFLDDALAVYGDRPAAVAHELTKLHESVERGTISELLDRVGRSKPRGEYVIVVGGAGAALRAGGRPARRGRWRGSSAGGLTPRTTSMSELPIVLLLLLVIAILLRMDIIFYLVYVLAGTYGLARWWSARSLKHLQVDTSLHRPYLHGREAPPSTITIENTSLLPRLGCATTSRLRPNLRASGRLITPLALGPKETVELHYDLVGRQRGVYAVGPGRVATGDLFGFAEVQGAVDEARALVVYPRVIPLDASAPLTSRAPYGTIASRQPIFADPARVNGVRPYQPAIPCGRSTGRPARAPAQLQVKKTEPAVSLTTRHLPRFPRARLLPAPAVMSPRVGHRRRGLVGQLPDRAATGRGAGRATAGTR